MDISTICVHGCDIKYDTTGAVSVPIFASSTFAHPGVGQSTGFDYSRSQNPTKEYLEHCITKLESGAETIAFSSGMAALSALMELFSPGDHIIASYDLYGGTFRLFSRISEKNGMKISYTAGAQEIAEKITPSTKAVIIESPTNPMMNVIDIQAAAQITQNKKLLLIVDNTFLTPVFQRPLSLGADIVWHSGTKYLGGHNDTLAGTLTVKDSGLSERLRFIAKTTGGGLSPFDSFLIIRGIKTLAVRMERHNITALTVANWLKTQGKVKKVYYIGLKDHPDYEISCRQASGFGGMISFSVYDERSVKIILENVKIIKYAESLGGTESLITYPLLQTHADLPQDEREARGINNCLLRLSVGLESADDIINDLKQAMEGC
ncbi:MAG: PLP-dependent aspartate aminotransferase family protein [Treponema sp.]|nr:PLP-dependent aspartate aminotransferase family protein [Treponema sp.]MCL2272497.1 PLP-dependent aspartate aminotransferase family protein [Treponema sp.]